MNYLLIILMVFLTPKEEKELPLIFLEYDGKNISMSYDTTKFTQEESLWIIKNFVDSKLKIKKAE